MEIESVWDYPRPPKIEPFKGHVRIVHQESIICDSSRAFRILETSHPPTYYIPREDCSLDLLSINSHQSFCEFKGMAGYYDLMMQGTKQPNVAWFYSNPSTKYASIKNHLCFYASKLDKCLVNDERVQAQEGDFYGGWITKNIKGPFKGAPGTWGW